MKLYEFAPTRSIRARWTLQELGVDFEAITVNLMLGEHTQQEFREINPACKLPALVDGDFVLTESVAIVLYLAASGLGKPSRSSDLPLSCGWANVVYRNSSVWATSTWPAAS